MTQLAALGKLPEAKLFPSEVRPEAIRALSIKPIEAAYWIEILPALSARGRADLVEAIEDSLAKTRRAERWSRDAGWRGALRKLDRRYAGGRLLALRKRLLPGRSP
jgi:hypothetical protein